MHKQNEDTRAPEGPGAENDGAELGGKVVLKQVMDWSLVE